MKQRATIPTSESGQNASEPRRHSNDQGLERATSLVLLGTSAVVLLALVFIALTHAGDRFGLDHASGARVALARYLDHGVLYPELYDNGFYGGSRFMPIPLVAHGLVAKLTGEYLVSGKLLAYFFALLLCAVLMWLLRRAGASWPLSIGLIAALFATRVGLNAVIDMRGDLPALILQLLGIGIVSNPRRASTIRWAAVFAALAFLAKTSAVWAPIAIAAWLLIRRENRALLRFALVYLASATALLLLFGAISDGRLFENVFGLAGSGLSSIRSLLTSPYRLLRLILSHAVPAVPLALILAWLAWRRLRERNISIYMVSLAVSLLIVWFVLADIGTGWNQLIDPFVLSALVLGESSAERRTGASHRTPTRLVALGVIVANILGVVLTYRGPVVGTFTGEASWTPRPLEGIADTGTKLLAEDPYLPVSLGQTPVVLDPFMLLRIERDHPRALHDLSSRIRDREFDLIALVEPLEPLRREWWVDVHFGIEVMSSINESYDFDFKHQGYYLYRPRVAVE